MDIRKIIRREIIKIISSQENKEDIEEIDLSVGYNNGLKPGIVRKFPSKNKGGNSLNITKNDGPKEFPKEF